MWNILELNEQCKWELQLLLTFSPLVFLVGSRCCTSWDLVKNQRNHPKNCLLVECKSVLPSTALPSHYLLIFLSLTNTETAAATSLERMQNLWWASTHWKLVATHINLLLDLFFDAFSSLDASSSLPFGLQKLIGPKEAFRRKSN